MQTQKLRSLLYSLFPLLRWVFQAQFLILDALGISLIFVGSSVASELEGQWTTTTLAIGSTLLTIGLGLPVAIFHQIRTNEDSFQLLRVCRRAGIRGIFESRKADRDSLQKAVELEAEDATSINFLGTSFRSVFGPDQIPGTALRRCIESPNVKLKVLLLDPDSKAAKERAAIERGNLTIRDIKMSLEIGIPSAMERRLRNLDQVIVDRLVKEFSSEDHSADVEFVNAIGVQVRTYEYDPMINALEFPENMFVEQYHFGRPSIVPYGGCIGEYVPVLQYRRDSNGYRFISAHFRYLWSRSKDRTSEMVSTAIQLYGEQQDEVLSVVQQAAEGGTQ